MHKIYSDKIHKMNEAILLLAYLWNSNEENDEKIGENTNNIKNTFPNFYNYMIKIRKEGRKIISKYEEYKTLYIKNENSNIIPLTAFIYLDYKISITEYENKKLKEIMFNGLVNTYFQDEEIGENLSDEQYIDYIDKINEFDDLQKFLLMKMLLNVNGFFDNFLKLIEKFEEIIEKNLSLIKEEIEIIKQHSSIYDYEKITIFKPILNENFYKNLDEIEVRTYMNLIFPVDLVIRYQDDKKNGFVTLGFTESYFYDESVKDENEKKDILKKMSILSDEQRFNILHSLIERPKYGKELSDELGITTATISYHTTNLMIENFISKKIEGNKVYYQINESGFKKVINYLSGFLGGKNA